MRIHLCALIFVHLCALILREHANFDNQRLKELGWMTKINFRYLAFWPQLFTSSKDLELQRWNTNEVVQLRTWVTMSENEWQWAKICENSENEWYERKLLINEQKWAKMGVNGENQRKSAKMSENERKPKNKEWAKCYSVHVLYVSAILYFRCVHLPQIWLLRQSSECRDLYCQLVRS